MKKSYMKSAILFVCMSLTLLFGESTKVQAEEKTEEEFVCAGEHEVAPSLLDNLKKLNQDLDLNESNEESASCWGLKRSAKSSGQNDVLTSSIVTPSIGDVKILAVMVDFEDVKFAEAFTSDYVNDIMYGEADATSDQYPKESLRAWYQRSSFGKLNFSGEVVKVSMEYTRDYYTTTDENPEGSTKFYSELIEKLNELDMDWAEYDSDGNNVVDAPCFLVAGEQGKWGSQWWSRKNNLFNTYVGDNTYAVGNFTMCMEGQMDGPTTAIHEFGHMLGLPDLYNTSDAGHQDDLGIHTTDMMHNNTGEFNGLCKFLLGWIGEEQIKTVSHGSELQNLALNSYAETGECAVLFVDPENESLLGEYYLVQYLDYEGNNHDFGHMGEDMQKHLQIYHVNAELSENGSYLLHDNYYDGDCKLIEAVDKDAEEIHGYHSHSSMARGSSIYKVIFKETYNCGFVTGDELTPYTAPSTGKYAADRRFESPDEFSGLSVTNIVVGEESASFDVSYESEAKETDKIELASLINLKKINPSNAFFSFEVNHDIWVNGNEQKPYLRQKGSTDKVAELTVDTMQIWKEYSGYYCGHRGFSAKIDGSTKLEGGMEYELVFPDKYFVTSYGVLSEEIVVSGIQTQLKLWSQDSVAISISEGDYNQQDCYSGCYEYVITENKILEFPVLKKDGSIWIYQADMDKHNILTQMKVIEGSETIRTGGIGAFGCGENGVYWLFVSINSTDKIYLLNEDKTIRKEIDMEVANLSVKDLGNGQIYISGLGMSVVLDIETMESYAFEPQTPNGNINDIKACGDDFLVSEYMCDEYGNYKYIYTIRDLKDTIVKKINIDGYEIMDIQKIGNVYELVVRGSGQIIKMSLNEDFLLKESVLLLDGIKKYAEVRATFEDGYLIRCVDKLGEEGYHCLLNKNGKLYTTTNPKWSDVNYDNIKVIELNGGLHMITGVGSWQYFSFQISDEIAMPASENPVSQIGISKDISFDEEGYVDIGDSATIEEYISGLSKTGDEEYEYIVWNQQSYLKISNAEKNCAKYIKLRYCEHMNQVTTKEAVASTCTEKGHTKEITCKDCGKVIQESVELPLAEHTYGEVIVEKEATCVETGTSCTICNVCGKEKRGEIPIDISKHMWDTDYTVDKEATETEEGSKSIHCSLCGIIDTNRIVTIPKLTVDAKPTVAPTAIPSSTPTATPSSTPTPTQTPTATQTPTPTQTPTATQTPTQTKVPSPSPTVTPMGTAIPVPNKIKDTKSNSSFVVLNYSNQKHEVAYAGIVSAKKNTTSIKVPDTIVVQGQTCKVTEIKTNALKNNKKIKSITLGKNIKKIGKKAFYNCKNVKKIVIKSKKLTSKQTGSSAFKGISKKAVIWVPKGKEKIYKKMFQKKGLNKKVKVKKIKK